MIYNITYEKKEDIEKIDASLGSPYGLLSRLKMGGIGSEKMNIVDASPLIEGLLQYEDQPNYCNIELRPRGVLVRFKYRAEMYGWAIPFAKLSVYKSEGTYRIYGDAEFIKVTKMLNSNALRQFMDKLLAKRVEYLASISGPFD
ncbi:MAG: hypothetical protein HKN87_00990 [Saprospiraceae bacterium]|nr:hypothetical protein [Saprospiraceae bacterium]